MIKNIEPLVIVDGRIDAVRRAAVHIQNEGSVSDSIYERCKHHFIFKKLSPAGLVLQNATILITHKPDDTMKVDWAGGVYPIL